MLLKGIAVLSAVIAVLRSISQPLWTVLVYFVVSYAELFLVAAAFCVIICAFVDMEKPQERDSKFYRVMMYLYIDMAKTLLRAKVTVRGLEKTPKEGRFLLVCNHQHMVDPGVILSYFKKSQLAFISKKENEKLPIINKFLHKIMCQSIERENDRQGLRVILKCIQLIKDDVVSVGVFPEGYTSLDGKLHHFRPGVFKIAQKANVPIVVCTINGTGALNENIKRLKRTDVALHLVDVLQPEDFAGKTTVELSEQIYEMMIADLGEDFRVEQ